MIQQLIKWLLMQIQDANSKGNAIPQNDARMVERGREVAFYMAHRSLMKSQERGVPPDVLIRDLIARMNDTAMHYGTSEFANGFSVATTEFEHCVATLVETIRLNTGK